MKKPVNDFDLLKVLEQVASLGHLMAWFGIFIARNWGNVLERHHALTDHMTHFRITLFKEIFYSWWLWGYCCIGSRCWLSVKRIQYFRLLLSVSHPSILSYIATDIQWITKHICIACIRVWVCEGQDWDVCSIWLVNGVGEIDGRINFQLLKWWAVRIWIWIRLTVMTLSVMPLESCSQLKACPISSTSEARRVEVDMGFPLFAVMLGLWHFAKLDQTPTLLALRFPISHLQNTTKVCVAMSRYTFTYSSPPFLPKKLEKP